MISYKGYISTAEMYYYDWMVIFMDTIYLQLSHIEKKALFEFHASYNVFKSVESSVILARVVFKSVSGFWR